MNEYPWTITITWGKAEYESGDDERPTETYSFAYKAELDAFMNGVVEAEGWFGFTVLEDSREQS